MADPFEDYSAFRGAIDEALKAEDAVGLLTFLRSAEGKSAFIACQHIGSISAEHGNAECLRVLEMCGLKLQSSTWRLAAKSGNVDRLAFAVSRGYTLTDCILELAIKNGHLACVDFLIEQGLPLEPYKHRGGRLGPDQMKCLQLMTDRAVPIHPSSMMAAVECGDLDVVRLLHQHGVPLWKHAVQKRKKFSLYRGGERDSVPKRVTLLIPGQPERVESIWRPLRYGQCMALPSLPL